MRQRKDTLEQWEYDRRPECWHIAWAAYRESEWLYDDLPIPETASEWTELRRWAKRFINRHHDSLSNNDETYRLLPTIKDSRYGAICRYLDSHNNAKIEWPITDCQAPDTAELRAAAMKALLKWPNRVMNQIGYIGIAT